MLFIWSGVGGKGRILQINKQAKRLRESWWLVSKVIIYLCLAIGNCLKGNYYPPFNFYQCSGGGRRGTFYLFWMDTIRIQILVYIALVESKKYNIFNRKWIVLLFHLLPVSISDVERNYTRGWFCNRMLLNKISFMTSAKGLLELGLRILGTYVNIYKLRR